MSLARKKFGNLYILAWHQIRGMAGCLAKVMQEPDHSSLGNQRSPQALRWSWQGLSAVPGQSSSASTLENHKAVTGPDHAGMREMPDRVRLPIDRQPASGEKLVCVTWCYGSLPWFSAFHPHLKAWAARHSIDLRTWLDPPQTGAFKKSVMALWLDAFLKSGCDWMMCVDADVMIHPLAPNPLAGGRLHGFWAMVQPAQEGIRAAWARWVRENFKREVHPNYRYRNDGVWMIDRATAGKWRVYAEQMMLPGDNESHYFNLWLHDAMADGSIVMRDLPQEWNRLPHRPPDLPNIPAWFYHCAGGEKLRTLGQLYLDGFLPQPRPAITIKPWAAEPEMDCLISIPYHWASDPWKGECLRYALRSIEQHWKHDWPLKVYGTERPEWLDENVFEQERSYPLVLLKSCHSAERVLWMNDDILFLKDTGEDDLQIPLRLNDLVPELPRLLHEENRWKRARGHVVGRLHHENGLDSVADFSTHVGYLFERKHARKVFDHFGVWHKFPMELAYHGLLESTGRRCDEKASWETRDDPAMRWLNVDDAWTMKHEFMTWLTAKFPQPSKWEKSDV